MSQLYHEFGVTLSRRSAGEAWGIRLAGGADLNSPLIIIRVISTTKSSASASSPFILRDHLFVVRQQVVNRHRRLWLMTKINSTQFVCWWYIAIWCNFHRPQQEKAMRFCAAWKFASSSYTWKFPPTTERRDSLLWEEERWWWSSAAESCIK